MSTVTINEAMHLLWKPETLRQGALPSLLRPQPPQWHDRQPRSPPNSAKDSAGSRGEAAEGRRKSGEVPPDKRARKSAQRALLRRGNVAGAGRDRGRQPRTRPSAFSEVGGQYEVLHSARGVLRRDNRNVWLLCGADVPNGGALMLNCSNCAHNCKRDKGAGWCPNHHTQAEAEAVARRIDARRFAVKTREART